MNLRGTQSKRVAILGASGHIAKNLIVGLNLQCKLYLFARSVSKVEAFLKDNNISEVHLNELDKFQEYNYDVVINCIGIGDPGKLTINMHLIFTVTEFYDNMVLKYLEGHSDTLYINLSSGAAYLCDFSHAVKYESYTNIRINQLSSADYYGITKINMEAKHRSYSYYNILDLRIFGFFSRFIDPGSSFLLNDIVRSLYNDEILFTSEDNIIRDYVHPSDLISLIGLLIGKININDVFDVYSLKPISKFSLLEHFSANFGLKYEFKSQTNFTSITGNKQNYYSENNHAMAVGYLPKYDALTAVNDEINSMLENKNKRGFYNEEN